MNEKCGMPENDLLDYFYGELTDEVKIKLISEHVVSCAECRETVDAYAAIKNSMDSMKINFSDDVWALHARGIKARLEKKKTFLEKLAGYFEVKKMRTVGVAFAVMLLMVFGVFFGKNIFETADNMAEKEMIENLDIMENLDMLLYFDETSGDIITGKT